MFRRLKFRAASVGESTPGKFTHPAPRNAPRYDLREPRRLPEPMLEINEPLLEIDDPSLELPGPQLSAPGSIAVLRRT